MTEDSFELKSTRDLDNEEKEEEERESQGKISVGAETEKISHSEDVDRGRDGRRSDVTRRENPEDLDPNQMEDLIDKILEKYGESDGRGERYSTNHDVILESKTKPGDDDVNEYSGIDSNPRTSSTWKSASGPSNTTRTERQWADSRASQRHGGSFEHGSLHPEQIGSVIRSQKGVTRTLNDVSEGLDEVNDDLEVMKKELERVQMNTYAVQLSSQFGGETMRDVVEIGSEMKPRWTSQRNSNWDNWIEEEEPSKPRHTDRYKQRDNYRDSEIEDTRVRETGKYQQRRWMDEKIGRDYDHHISHWTDDHSVQRIDRQTTASDSYTWANESKPRDHHSSNEWIEERQGLFRLGQNKDVLHLDRQTAFTGEFPSTVPGRGRSHIKENDIQLTHLLTIAEPNSWERNRKTEEWTTNETTNIHNRRLGRTSDEGVFTLSHSPSSSSGVHTGSRKDGYCYMCEEFEGGRRSDWLADDDQRSFNSEKVFSSKVPRRSFSISGDLDIISRARSQLDLSSVSENFYPKIQTLRSNDSTWNSSHPSSSSSAAAAALPRSTQRQQPLASFAASPQIQKPEFTSRFLTKVRRRRNSLGERMTPEAKYRVHFA